MLERYKVVFWVHYIVFLVRSIACTLCRTSFLLHESEAKPRMRNSVHITMISILMCVVAYNWLLPQSLMLAFDFTGYRHKSNPCCVKTFFDYSLWCFEVSLLHGV